MMFKLNHIFVTANRLHSLKQSCGVWTLTDFRRNMHLLVNKAFVNGEWVSAKSKAEFEVVNPANGSIVGQVPDFDVNDVNEAINAADTAFHSNEWSLLTAKDRSALLKVCIVYRLSCDLNDNVKLIFISKWHRNSEQDNNSIYVIKLMYFCCCYDFIFRNGICYWKVIEMKLHQL